MKICFNAWAIYSSPPVVSGKMRLIVSKQIVSDQMEMKNHNSNTIDQLMFPLMTPAKRTERVPLWLNWWSKHPGQKVRKSSSPGSTPQSWDQLMTYWDVRPAVVTAGRELRRDSSNSRSGDSRGDAFGLQQEHQDGGQLGLWVFTESIRWVWMTHLTKLSPTMCCIFPHYYLWCRTTSYVFSL